MERLTGRDPITRAEEFTAKLNKPEELIDVYEKLAYYEDLAEQGRLVELPCKTGDTIYQLRKKRHIYGVGISPRTVGWALVWSDGDYELKHQGQTPCRKSGLGKTWFLTQEAAEAKLREMEE